MNSREKCDLLTPAVVVLRIMSKGCVCKRYVGGVALILKFECRENKTLYWSDTVPSTSRYKSQVKNVMWMWYETYCAIVSGNWFYLEVN